jgi:hypothetical protein
LNIDWDNKTPDEMRAKQRLRRIEERDEDQKRREMMSKSQLQATSPEGKDEGGDQRLRMMRQS